MSSDRNNGTGSDRGTGTPGTREVAHRLFAAEYDDATYSYSESDEERAPNYVVTPTGARINRLFVVGVLTEVGQAGESMLRARVVDPTGAFVVYAGKYQPEAMAFLDSTEPPAFVAVTGKARTFQPEDSDRVFTSIRPEEINEVDGETRDRWTVSTAERTLERVATVATALDTGSTGDDLRDTLRESGVGSSFAAGIPIALEQYGTTRTYLADIQRLALDATRLVADEIDTVDDLALAPDDGDGSGSFEPVIDGISISSTDTVTPEASSTTEPVEEKTTPTAESEQTDVESEPTPTTETTTADETESPQTEPTQTESPTETETPQTESSQTGSPPGTESPQTESPQTEPTQTESSPETTNVDEFDPEEFELDEEVRQEVESEYGTDFSTASEVDSPGESEIEVDDSAVETGREVEEEPTFDEVTDESDEFDESDESDLIDEKPVTETEPASETDTTESPAVDEPATATEDTSIEAETETDTDTASDTDTETEIETAGEDVDIETVLIETMRDLADGDGVDRETLIERVSEDAGVSDDAVEDAIQEALMSGQCYEPNDGILKPI